MTAEEFREATALFHTMFLFAGRTAAHRRGAARLHCGRAGRSGHGEGPGCLSTQGAGIHTAPDAGAGRVIMLRVVDEYWMDQIDAMNDLKQGIGLRAYAQTDPRCSLQKGRLRDVRADDRCHPGGRPCAACSWCASSARRLMPPPRRSNGNGWPRSPASQAPATARSKAAGKKGGQDRPQRPLPLRQRPEVEKVHLQGVSQRAAVRTHKKQWTRIWSKAA